MNILCFKMLCLMDFKTPSIARNIKRNTLHLTLSILQSACKVTSTKLWGYFTNDLK